MNAINASDTIAHTEPASVRAIKTPAKTPIEDLFAQHKALCAWTEDKANDDTDEDVRDAVFRRIWGIEHEIAKTPPTGMADVVLQLEILDFRLSEDRLDRDISRSLLAGAKKLAGRPRLKRAA